MAVFLQTAVYVKTRLTLGCGRRLLPSSTCFMRVFTCMPVMAWPERATDCRTALSNPVSAALGSDTAMRHVWVQEERARALQLREEGKIPPTLESWSEFVEAATGHRSCALFHPSPCATPRPSVCLEGIDDLTGARPCRACSWRLSPLVLTADCHAHAALDMQLLVQLYHQALPKGGA